MITNKKWVATGSTATLIAGGLFFGAPAASAAPGDAACLQASVQFNAALNAAGIDVAFVNQLELATAAVVTAGENLATVTASLNVEGLAAEVDATAKAAFSAQDLRAKGEGAVKTAVDAAIAANVDPETDPGVLAAREALIPLLAQERAAIDAAAAADAAYDIVLADPTLLAAEADFKAAAAAADALLAQLSGDEALAAELVALFKAFLAACDAGAIGVTPVVNPTVPVTVIPTPTPTGTNKGMNVQTAAAAEDNSAALALIGGLLAAGVAVPVAMAARMRRLERAQR